MGFSLADIDARAGPDHQLGNPYYLAYGMA
jgi:hypothetical protein